MTDRRRAPRYNLCRTTRAQVGLLQDVWIQSANGNAVIVLSSTYPPNCDRLLMQVVRSNGDVASLSARVLRTAPVLQAGSMQFLVELHVDGFAENFPHSAVRLLG